MATPNTNHRLVFIIGYVVILIAALAWAQNSDGLLVIDQPVSQDAYAARDEVQLQASVDGDFVAAGSRVIVDGDVAGDIIAAARTIEINSPVNDDLRLAGQHIRVTAPVSGHVVATGQTVTIEKDIGDFAWLAGHTVTVSGNVGKGLSIRADNIVLDAEVVGDVEFIGGHLDLGPRTVIRGDVRWRGDSEANISPGATIEGELIEEPKPGLVDELKDGETYAWPLSLIVAVAVLFLLFSEPLRAGTKSLLARPGMSLLLGAIVALIGLPLAIALFVTGVGVWLGFAVLLVYFSLLLLGVLTGLYAVSDIAVRKFYEEPNMWRSLAAIFITVVAVRLIMTIPWFGAAVFIAILLLGVGMLCWKLWSVLKPSRESEPDLAAQVTSSS